MTSRQPNTLIFGGREGGGSGGPGGGGGEGIGVCEGEAKSTVHKPHILKIKVNRSGMEPGVISKEAVGNSLDILNPILGRRYYQNPPKSHRK